LKHYNIEHIGIIVKEPVAMGHWYKKVMGFNIRFEAQDEEKAVAFVTDSSEKVMLEFGKVPDVSPLSRQTDHHLQFHIAVESNDPENDVEHFVSNGARFIEKCPLSRPGDYLIVLEDPWGNCIQLVKRESRIK